MRIRAMCKKLGIVDFGVSGINKFIETYSVTNHLDFFALTDGMTLGDGIFPLVSKKVIDQINGKKRFVLWEFVQVANLPYIQSSARKIFQGYTDLGVAFNDVEKGEFPLFRISWVFAMMVGYLYRL